MKQLYTPLLTDFYQLTMAYGYWRLNMHEQRAAFHLLFRHNPFKGDHALSCGLGSVVSFLQNWQLQADDLAYLATLKNSRNHCIFPKEFLDYLANLRFTCDLFAIPEGTVVFPHTPLIRVEGPLLQCQLIESALLNIVNFQSLIATKATRVCMAADGDPVIEFGMRRAQGPDGALSASRAAYIGGCIATSNALAGKLYGIPVRGTHAHSWVTAFENEETAFQAYADVLPDSGVLLVDTYDTVQGVKNAIQVGKKLREQGSDLLAIRLDSGDMAALSIKARQLLDEAGFKNTGILASNSLDEYAIRTLKQKGAKISSWGVGTHLITAYDQAALDGVYKLSALQNSQGTWEYKLKISEQKIKISNPGRHQVRRFFLNETYFADVIYDLDLNITDSPQAMLLNDSLSTLHVDDYDACVDLLKPVLREGQLIEPLPSIHQTREEAMAASQLFTSIQRDRPYAVGLEKNLYDIKTNLINTFKKENSSCEN